jgi:hypothetical protein
VQSRKDHCFLQEDRAAALKSFSKLRYPDARALVETSHNADRGLLFFLVPVIIDRIFYKLAPWLFQTSTLRLMQLPDMRFSAVQARKRIDRALQFLILGGLATVLARAMWKVALLAVVALQKLSANTFL